VLNALAPSAGEQPDGAEAHKSRRRNKQSEPSNVFRPGSQPVRWSTQASSRWWQAG